MLTQLETSCCWKELSLLVASNQRCKNKKGLCVAKFMLTAARDSIHKLMPELATYLHCIL